MSHPLIRARNRDRRINFGQIQQEFVFTRPPEKRYVVNREDKIEMPSGFTEHLIVRSTDEGPAYHRVAGKPVVIRGFENRDFFVHHPLPHWRLKQKVLPKFWAVSEATTGLKVTRGEQAKTRKAAIQEAQKRLDNVGKPLFDKTIATAPKIADFTLGQIQQELVLTRAPKATDPIAPELDTLAVFARLFPPQEYVTEPIVNGIREAYRQIHPHIDLPVAVKGKHPKPLENILAYYYGYGSGDPDRSIEAFWLHAHGYAPNGGPLPEIHRYPSLEGRGGYMMLAICPDAPKGRGKAIMADLGKCYPLYRVKATNGLSGQTLRFLGQDQLIFPGMPATERAKKKEKPKKKGRRIKYYKGDLNQAIDAAIALDLDIPAYILATYYGYTITYDDPKGLHQSHIVVNPGSQVEERIYDHRQAKWNVRSLLAPAADLSGEVLHCGAWAMNEETGMPYCVAFGPACEAATGFPVLSPVQIAKFTRRLKDSDKAIHKTKAEIQSVKEGPSTRGQAKKLEELRLTLNAAYGHYMDASWHLRRASGHFVGIGAAKSRGEYSGPLAATRKLKKVCIGWREVHSKFYNKKIWKCDEYARPAGEASCLVEPATAPFSKRTIKSLAKWYAETWNEEFGWRVPEFIKEIRDRGGIRPYKARTRAGKVDEEYMTNVPLFLRRKKGVPPDEMASEMGFDTDSDLYDAISEVYGAGKRKAAPTRKKKWYEFAEEAHYDIIEKTEGPR